MPKAETFMMKPRSGAATQVTAREGRARRASIPQRIVESRHFKDGDRLYIAVPSRVNQDVDAINLWLDEDPQRRDILWQQDARKPVLWSGDGVPRSTTELITMVIEAATQARPRGEVWGPQWIVDHSGMSLNKLVETLEADSTNSD